MMILFAILLMFGGIVSYAYAGNGPKSNDWLCMLGFVLLLTGTIIIGSWMDGTL